MDRYDSIVHGDYEMLRGKTIKSYDTNTTYYDKSKDKRSLFFHSITPQMLAVI